MNVIDNDMSLAWTSQIPCQQWTCHADIDHMTWIHIWGGRGRVAVYLFTSLLASLPSEGIVAAQTKFHSTFMPSFTIKAFYQKLGKKARKNLETKNEQGGNISILFLEQQMPAKTICTCC